MSKPISKPGSVAKITLTLYLDQSAWWILKPLYLSQWACCILKTILSRPMSLLESENNCVYANQLAGCKKLSYLDQSACWILNPILSLLLPNHVLQGGGECVGLNLQSLSSDIPVINHDVHFIPATLNLYRSAILYKNQGQIWGFPRPPSGHPWGPSTTTVTMAQLEALRAGTTPSGPHRISAPERIIKEYGE